MLADGGGYLFIQDEYVAMRATWWSGARIWCDDVTPGHITACRTCASRDPLGVSDMQHKMDPLTVAHE